jgi:pimeloyl-ACP methyl ester carboxylesterase
MARAHIDGIAIEYEVIGTGEPLLMLAPGGFDATMSRWRTNGIWKAVNPLERYAREFRMIIYDRRENGVSGGRVEALTWDAYAREALGLLDHLGIDRAMFLGGCIGCSLALAIAARAPERCRALLMHWPVGGYRWMLKGRGAFDGHLRYVREHGLAGAAEKARETQSFWRGDPAGGPWASVIATDPAFARDFVQQDQERYLDLVARSRDALFSDALPSGAPAEAIMRITTPSFIMPGDDASHATSAAHALRELVPGAVLSPLMPPAQDGLTVGQWITEAAASVRALAA